MPAWIALKWGIERKGGETLPRRRRRYGRWMLHLLGRMEENVAVPGQIPRG